MADENMTGTPTPSVNPVSQGPVTTGGGNKGAMIGAVVVAILALGGLGAWYMSANKPAMPVAPAPEQKTPTDTNTNTGVPAGTKAKDTLCFTVYLPTDATTGDENACYVSFRSQTVTGNIIPELRDKGSAKGMHDATRLSSDKIVSEEAIMVSGYPAYKVVRDIGGVSGKLEHLQVMIYYPGKYTYSGSKVYGFEVNSSYNTEAQKTAADTMLSTWVWK